MGFALVGVIMGISETTAHHHVCLAVNPAVLGRAVPPVKLIIFIKITSTNVTAVWSNVL